MNVHQFKKSGEAFNKKIFNRDFLETFKTYTTLFQYWLEKCAQTAEIRIQ